MQDSSPLHPGFRTNGPEPSARISAALPVADLSCCISLARLLLIVGLVFLHYQRFPGAELTLFQAFDRSETPVAAFIGSAVLYFFFAAVPLLSMISGYLFVSGVSQRGLYSGLRRRLGTLLVPLLVWNGFALAGIGALYHLTQERHLFGLVQFDYVQAGIGPWVDAVLGLSRSPALFQFWFVRDLIATLMLSPVLLWGLRHGPLLGAVLLGGAWLIGHDLWLFRRADVVFFFYLGGWLALAGRAVPAPRPHPWLWAYLALVLLRTSIPAVIDELDPQVRFWLDMATRAMRLVGVVACWAAIAALAQSTVGRRLGPGGSYAFMIFALHYPAIEIVKAALAAVVPLSGSPALLIHYLASALGTVALCMLAARMLAMGAPRLFALLNGGRPLAM